LLRTSPRGASQAAVGGVCPRARRNSSAVHTGLVWFGRSVVTHVPFTLSLRAPLSLRSLTTLVPPTRQGSNRWLFPTCQSPAVGCRVDEALLQLAEHGRRQLDTSGKLSVARAISPSVSESARSVVASSVCTVLWKHGAIMLPHSSDSCSTAQ